LHSRENFDDRKKIIEELSGKLKLDVIDYDDCYRIGKPGNANRPLLIKCLRKNDKYKILSKTKELKGSKIYINHDLTKAQATKEKQLRDHLKVLKQTNPELRGVVYNGILTTFDKNNKSKKYNVREDCVIPMHSSA